MPQVVEAKEYPLAIRRFTTRREMGAAAAADIADFLRAKMGIGGRGVRVIFAAADSQRDMLRSLIADQRLDWSRVTAFHMDEYIGLPADAPQRLGSWLKRELIKRVPIGRFHALSPESGVEAAIEGKLPSSTCCWRLTGSSPISLTQLRSWRSVALPGSLKARCPLTPIPRQTASIGASASSRS